MIIAIDYGLKKCGLAVSYEGKLAEPLKIIKTANLKKEIERLKPDKIIVGDSKFAKDIENMLGCKVEFVDESLSTVEAQGISKKPDDAIAAAIILQRYLDV
jgi:RNase H-fold protein (predicted Holliday junction resolvase)